VRVLLEGQGRSPASAGKPDDGDALTFAQPVAPAEVEEEDEEQEFGGYSGRREQKGTPEGPDGIEEFANDGSKPNKTATANTQTAKTKVQNAILEILR
jgi:hypothetical protein